MTLVSIVARGAVRVIKLNDAKRRNILTADLCRALSEAVAKANADPGARAIIITGAPPAFCAGADLNDLERAAQGDTGALQLVYASFMDVARSDLPTIAAVNGVAVGAGLNLALACDIRLAASNARFDARFLKIGLHPGGGHSWMLLRAVGWAQACRMLAFNRPVGADEAKAIGLVQEVLDPADLVERAIEFAAHTADLPRELIIQSKQALQLAAGSDHQSSFDHEATAQLASLQAPPFRDLVTRLRVDIASR